MRPDSDVYYALTLWDPALPGIVSGDKSYYGSEQEMAEYFRALDAAQREPELIATYQTFCNGDRQVRSPGLLWEKPLLEPVTVLAKREFLCGKTVAWEHLNTWGFPYSLKAKEYHNTHLWLKHGEQYLRCIRPCFLQLYWQGEALEDAEDIGWWPVWEIPGRWGNAEMLVSGKAQDGRRRTSSRFFVAERYFDTEEALRADVLSFDGAGEYREFCNEIFGDG